MLYVDVGESVVSSSFNRKPFMTINEGNDDCGGGPGAGGPPWNVPYQTGRYRFGHSDVEVEVDVKMSSGDQIEQVVSMSLAYRTPFSCQRVVEGEFPIQKNVFDVQP